MLLLEDYMKTLHRKAPGTKLGYERALVALIDWMMHIPGSGGMFVPAQFTRTAFETYMSKLEAEGYSISYQLLVRAATRGFARWLIEEKRLLKRDPTRHYQINPAPIFAPRVLNQEQRFVLRTLVEREDNMRGTALFALGYYAGCRVSDVSWLMLENTHVNERSCWVKIGHKNGKMREINLARDAYISLQEYLTSGERRMGSPFVFTSQRGDRLTEAGIHHWFRGLKQFARKGEWELIEDISYHDLRHDFAHRAREAGWSLEEIAFYLGHVTRRGTPAIQTTVRYTQVSREQIKEKLKLIRG